MFGFGFSQYFSPKMIDSDIPAIIAIINSLTGEEDDTYLSAVNSLSLLLGGSGNNEDILSGLNEIGGILSAEWEDKESELAALNEICLALGGEGGHTSELAAWEEIEELGITTVEQTEYKQRVEQIGALIVDEDYCFAEIAKAVDDGYYDKIALWFDKSFGVHGETGTKQPIISFSFDDGKSSDYTAYQHFAAKGKGRGTSFINTKFIDNPGYLTWAQIAEMYADRWDFQCHCWSHARSNLLAGGDVDYTLGLTGCTNEQIIEELEKSNADFITHGLPLPIHLAYPNYVTDWDRVTPIVAQYRQSMRVGSNLYVTFGKHNKIIWFNYWGPAFTINSNDIDEIKGEVDSAVFYNITLHEAGHTVADYDLLDDLLDYIYAKGVTPTTVKDYYEQLNSYRYKLVNVARNNYEALVYLDNGIKLSDDYQGWIIFNDTYANIGATIADYYIAKGYRVGFWDDSSDEACSYNWPSTTRYKDAVPITASASTDRITLSSHGLIDNQLVFLTGTTEPGGITFNTLYYIQYINVNEFKIRSSRAGAAIDLTSDGVGLFLNTYSHNEIWKAYSGGSLKTIKAMVQNTTNITLSDYPLNCSLIDMGLHLIQRISGGPASITFSNDKIIGDIPVEFLNLTSPGYVNFSYNSLTGGLNNLSNMKSMVQLTLNNNLIADSLPTEYSKMINMTTLNIGINQLTGSLPREYETLVKMNNFYVNNNLLSGAIPIEYAAWTAIQRFRFQNNAFTSYEAGTINAAMTSFIEFNVNTNQLPSAEINKILADCVAWETAHPATTTKTLNLGGTGNGAPTGQGETDKATLEATGKWIVTTN